jgi:hypothetical protein
VNLVESASRDRWQARFPLLALTDNTATIDPATVTYEQLRSVPGVDDQNARWFMAYRDAGYSIRNSEDLRQAGIGPSARNALASTFRDATHGGIVYVCEANYIAPGKQMGARFHYGIQYKIVVQDGIVQPASNIWMGALSRSQKAAKGAIPDDEWLGPTALPRLPHEQHLTDELSGLDDYPDL